jgi:pseudouridine-5'-phosphate glycosidase
VSRALQDGSALVALESTVITHGLPYPENIQLARDLETRVRQEGATPATIAVLNGCVHIGLTDAQLELLVDGRDVRKISRRDFAAVLVQGGSGGTTVAGTMLAARRAGLQVFATGGIGGVHEVGTLDISADLETLADTPMIVVCAGAKAILDLPATLEYLETRSVPVVGYGTDEFPAFYSRSSGLPVSIRLDGPEAVARFAATHWELGLKSAVLVCVPLSAADELPREIADPAIDQALAEARTKGIHGQPLTPFLLRRVSELTAGASLQANLRLLNHNAGVAAEIALQMCKQKVLLA